VAVVVAQVAQFIYAVHVAAVVLYMPCVVVRTISFELK
jgi:hypothetical protein